MLYPTELRGRMAVIYHTPARFAAVLLGLWALPANAEEIAAACAATPPQEAVIAEAADARRIVLSDGRIPAHLVAGGVWTQFTLLKNGLAYADALSETPDCLKALFAAESRARRKGTGLWAYGSENVLAAWKPDIILPHAGRYRIVEGKVISIGKTRFRTYSTLAGTGRGTSPSSSPASGPRPWRKWDLTLTASSTGVYACAAMFSMTGGRR